MGKIRVLIIDDAVVVRRMVSDVLSEDPDLEVVGTAANGKIGLSKILQLNPDVVTLDIEMPEMNGLETIAALRKLYRRLPVIMFSTLTELGAAATFDALSLGANDYVTKPANVGSVAAAKQALRTDLIPKIKALCTKNVRVPPTELLRAATSIRVIPSQQSSIGVVAIGISTGGPNALCEVLPELPAEFPVPILIVQHMPPMFTKLLADRLDKQSKLRVHEAVQGDPVLPGHVYIAPGDYHMTVNGTAANARLGIHRGAPENSCRPAVDAFFRSVVDVYRSETLGVIMTGMGQDGLRGCERIREVGGQILAQDEPSSVVWGMPGFIVRAGLADEILPLNQFANTIVRRVQSGRTRLDSTRKATI